MRTITTMFAAVIVAAMSPVAAADDAAVPDGPDDLDAMDDLDELDALDAETSPSGIRMRELRGYVAQELRSYVFDRGGAGEDEQSLSVLQLDVLVDVGSRVSVFATPRLLVDAFDTDLHRYEPLEAYASVSGARWDLRFGLLVENLGIVDAFNPLDVINRRDFGTDILDPVRLGELGVRARYRFRGGKTIGEPTVTAYVLPVWRPTELPTDDSRFSLSQSGAVFRDDMAVEPDGVDEVLVGARVEHTLTTDTANADVQYVVTRGPERMPGLVPMPLPDGGVALAPEYHGVTTAGLGFRAVPNAPGWAKLTFKTEVAYKRPYRLDSAGVLDPDDYVQYAVGVDRIIPAPLRSRDELQIMVEYLGESGASDSTAEFRPFRSDLAVRLFWQAGDFSRTSLELRGIVDVDSGELIGELTASRKLRFVHDDLELSVSAQLFDPARGEPGFLAAFPNNSNVRTRLQLDF